MVAFGIFPVFMASILLQLPAILSVGDNIIEGRKGKFNENDYLGHECDPNRAKVEDTPDPRRPRANVVCCCEAAAIYMRAHGNEGDGCILLFC